LGREKSTGKTATDEWTDARHPSSVIRHSRYSLLDFILPFGPSSVMGLPPKPVTLSVEQIDELNRRLSTMRHDVNNHLSLILAALEVVRYKPQLAEKMMATLSEQPAKITAAISQYSQDFEKTFGIVR
jgi:hypothetical protein